MLAKRLLACASTFSTSTSEMSTLGAYLPVLQARGRTTSYGPASVCLCSIKASGRIKLVFDMNASSTYSVLWLTVITKNKGTCDRRILLNSIIGLFFCRLHNCICFVCVLTDFFLCFMSRIQVYMIYHCYYATTLWNLYLLAYSTCFSVEFVVCLAHVDRLLSTNERDAHRRSSSTLL